MQTQRKRVHGAALGIVGRVVDELIIQGHFRRLCEPVAIVGLEDLFEAGIRQLPVTDENAETAGVEEGLVDGRDVVDDSGNASLAGAATSVAAATCAAGAVTARLPK